MRRLEKESKKNLLYLARELGLKNYSKLTKSDLITKITGEFDAYKIIDKLKEIEVKRQFEIDQSKRKSEIDEENLYENKKRNWISIITVFVTIIFGIIGLIFRCQKESPDLEYSAEILDEINFVADTSDQLELNIIEKIETSIKFSLLSASKNIEVTDVFIEIENYYECQKWDVHTLAENAYNNYRIYLTPKFKRYRLPVPTISRGYDSWLLQKGELVSIFAIIDMNKYDLAEVVVKAKYFDHMTKEHLIATSNVFPFYGRLCKQDSLVKQDFLNEEINISPYLYKLLVCVDIWDKIDEEDHYSINEEAFEELADLFNVDTNILSVIVTHGKPDMLDKNKNISSEYRKQLFMVGRQLEFLLSQKK